MHSSAEIHNSREGLAIIMRPITRDGKVLVGVDVTFLFVNYICLLSSGALSDESLHSPASRQDLHTSTVLPTLIASVMQSWSNQTGQCIFCAFRSTARSSLRQSGNRFFYNGARLARDRAAERERRRGVGVGSFRLQLGQEKYGKLRKRSAARKDDNYGRERYLNLDPRDNIRKAVAELKNALEKSMSGDPKHAEYATFDPANKYWESFEKKLKSIYARETDKDDGSADNDLASIRAKLMDALQFDGPIGLQRALYFAFIDHVIASRATTGDGKLRQFADLRYPTEWYPVARQFQRKIHLHVGPTNSGKTYNALKRLEESGNGFYAGPLRLLAHEVYSRFRAKGIPCNLMTGDDVRLDERVDAKLTSSTVEMVDISRTVDVAVIDEIQMLAQEDRGWAWTRAFLGAIAKEVHLCGETRIVPLIRELAASMGDDLVIHQYERLNPLKAMSKSLRGNLKNLRKGDCVVSFSVLGIHAMKKQIEIDTGRRVAIIYGSLPPETRAQQAALFNDPDNDYDFLVASDAIGMGLNLSIKRIIFETIYKRGNSGREKLSISQLKQIAGRAGRYRTAHQGVNTQDASSTPDEEHARLGEYRATATVGLVTCLDEDDLRYIQVALRTEPEPIKHAVIIPPAEFVDEFASRLPSGIPFEYILDRLSQLSVLNSRYQIADIRDQLKSARVLAPVKDLSVVSRYVLAAAPADMRSSLMQRILQAFGRCVADMKMVTVADVEEVPLEVLERPLTNDRSYLVELELLHKALVLYLWLSYRFVNVFKDREMAFYAKSMCEERINRCLLEFSANPALGKRLQKMKDLTAANAEVANTANEKLRPEEALLDQSFAAGDNIEPPAESSSEADAQTPLSPQESTHQLAPPGPWDSAGRLAGGAPQQDTEGAPYARAHG